MIRALYTAASGMVVEMRRLDLTSSNLFFAQIPGYKASSLLLASQPTTAGLSTDVQSKLAGQFVDPSPGPLRPTNRPLDLALEEEGFFTVQTKAGPAYTRDGRFRKGPDGVVTDGNGNALLGENGPIQFPADVPSDAPIVVEDDGTFNVNGKAVDRLRIEGFDGYRGLQAAGGSLFYPTGAASPKPAQARVLQGSLEDANTSGVLEMTRTVESMRAFESYQKVIQTIDEATGESVRRIGRLA